MSQYLTYAFWQMIWQNVFTGAVRILVILVVFWIARIVIHRIIDVALSRLMARQAANGGGEDRANRLRTLQSLVNSIVGYLLLFVVIVMVLHALSFDVTGIITTAGIGGLAIGIGAQKLVRDVISGFFLLIEDQFSVSDYVTIGTATGTVEEIGMRITRLRDESGRLWILSNGDISVVTNHSRSPVESFVEIGIAAAADVKHAEAVIEIAGELMASDPQFRLSQPPRAVGIAACDATKTVLRVSIVAEPRILTAVQLRAREIIRERLVDAGVAIA